IFVCGRYEGIDERISCDFIDEEISLGDYVLTGGELGAMVVIEAVTRLIPGVLGSADSAVQDSFSGNLLDFGHYTRPRDFEGSKVPDVLLSGNHKDIEKYRFETSMIRTFLKRTDLLENRELSKREIEILKKWCRDIEKIIETQSLRGTGSLSGN
ncbi:MAG: tRNA (guanine37-N1)-methyltransferase, partial [Thermodesulfobacteriota bacterium]|nr:tRNA (guanine37-N1)-methyltransferase [Thermodesulfobacteriota bacterium]